MAENKKKRDLFSHPKTHFITIQSRRRLVMEGVEEIVFCDPDKMILKGTYVLEIQGTNLQLEELGNDNMAVCGRICSVTFPEEAL